MLITFDTSIYRYNEMTDEEVEFDVTVEADLYAGEKATWDCPGCPPSADINSVLKDGKNEILSLLADDEIDELIDKALEDGARRAEEARADAADHAIDMWKERKLGIV